MKIIVVLLTILLSLFSKSPNHLVGQTSPYLKQHLYNPVDWYPWSENAFIKAKKEHKLIFLSIGYSTCHWCHVMEKESFNNPKIARILNRYFVSIKVDKEELPQIDKYYQDIYKRVKGKDGGWPLTVIMDSQKNVVFITTYMPPKAGYGSKGLEYIAKYYGSKYSDFIHLKPLKSLKPKLSKKFDKRGDLYSKIVDNVYKSFDKKYKGFGDEKKYPNSSLISLLLDIYEMTGNKKAKSMAIETLDAMINNSLYDQIGGGFFRYTTDKKWLSPHFEKMLYTNAQLITQYVKAYKIVKKKRYKDIVIQSLKEFDEHFSNKSGLYYGASDANSNNEEGKYYIYKYNTALKYLLKHGIKANDAKMALRYFDIASEGNFDSEFALARITKNKKPKNIKKIIELLNDKRKEIGFPFVDKKIITSSNAMMIKAKLESSIFDRRYENEALKSLNNLLTLMQKGNSLIYHQTIDKNAPRQLGFLEDYAYLCDTLLCAYNKTFKKEYLEKAVFLEKSAIKQFYKNGRWYLDKNHFTKADISDKYYTSPLSVMVSVVLKISTYNSSLKLYSLAKKTISKYDYQIITTPNLNAKMSENYIALKNGYIIIKSSKANLLKKKKQIDEIKYPFLLKEVVKNNNFLLCDIKSCFGYGKYSDVIKSLLERIKLSSNKH